MHRQILALDDESLAKYLQAREAVIRNYGFTILKTLELIRNALFQDGEIVPPMMRMNTRFCSWKIVVDNHKVLSINILVSTQSYEPEYFSLWLGDTGLLDQPIKDLTQGAIAKKFKELIDSAK